MNVIETLTVRQCLNVDRCNLEMLTKTSDEFVDLFSTQLAELRYHNFIAKEQSRFLKEKKANLPANEVLVLGDVAENYFFIVEAPSFHWTNNQATLHPFVIYYSENNSLKHLNFVIISDYREHNIVAVHLFQGLLISFLREELGNNFDKVLYFSDGCAAQYKNRKNFINLTYHKLDFQMEAEWHFFATSHGKGPCNGLGGTVKRLAAKTSLQRPFDNQILTPLELYKRAEGAILNINFEYVPMEKYLENEAFLRERFEKAVGIVGTRKFHSYVPSVNQGKLHVKLFSASAVSYERTIEPTTPFLMIDQMIGYVIVALNINGSWDTYMLE